MKNENVPKQALHSKLYAVLVHILPYNCSETDYSSFQHPVYILLWVAALYYLAVD